MQELSLNILDIAENSVKAGAALVTVGVCYRPAQDRFTVTIADDGCGMDAETVRKVTDPFYTTRTTRRVGMGLPLWKMAAEMTGGAMTVESAPGVGTTVTAVFGLSHIDRLPLGDLPQTMATLIGGSPEKDFRLEFDYDGVRFAADTREYRAVLGEEISLAEPEVLAEKVRCALGTAAEGQRVTLVLGEREETLCIPPTSQLTVGSVQNALDGLVRECPELTVDYIHGETAVRELCRDGGYVGLLFDGMRKEELFRAVSADGCLPRKTFSMGHAEDKRYYLEARRIR